MPKRAFSINRVTRSSSMREAELLENSTASSASMSKPMAIATISSMSEKPFWRSIFRGALFIGTSRSFTERPRRQTASRC